jgi:hypothetical protein
VKVLLTSAVLAPGKRTVPAILQTMGRSAEPDYQTYHRVLNRAVWSPLTVSGYPETSQHRYTSIKQPPCGNEKQGDYMAQACSA